MLFLLFPSEGKIQAQNVLVSAPTDRNLGKLKGRGCCTTHCNNTVVSDCKVVFLATKPHIIPGVLEEIFSAVTPDHVIISMAAGVPILTLEKVSFGTIVPMRCANKGFWVFQ
ncbi:hypothetical protein FKM82_022227 [Ascaphus truei]